MADPNYNFLNDYIGRITGKQASDAPIVDRNAFYDVPEDDEEAVDTESNTVDQQFQSAADNFANDWNPEGTNDESLDDSVDGNGNGNEDAPLDDNDFGESEDGEEDTPEEETDPNEDSDLYGLGANVGTVKEASTLSGQIADKESGGDYKAFNPAGGGAGAVGKYQIRWNLWKDSIEHVTGVKTRSQFLNNPAAQEKFFQVYKKTVLQPAIKELSPYNRDHLSSDQLAMLAHFRGVEGAKNYLMGKVSDKPESYNSSISSYIGKKQTGGEIFDVRNLDNSDTEGPQKAPFIDLPRNVKVFDNRKVDAITGKPVTDDKRLHSTIDTNIASQLIRAAHNNGIDPYTALAMGFQESGLKSRWANNPLHLLNADHPDVFDQSMKTLADKFKYAKSLGKISEADQIQAFNGYGKVGKNTEGHQDMMYGIDVTDKPIDMNKTPLYGQRIIDVRDNIIKKDPYIAQLVQSYNPDEDRRFVPLYKPRTAKEVNAALDMANTMKGNTGITFNRFLKTLPAKATFQSGGFAETPESQYVGLNNPNYDEMVFPMEGVNEFRGLDDGSPVYLEDEAGKKIVLKGKKDKAKMKGRVYEKRI